MDVNYSHLGSTCSRPSVEPGIFLHIVSYSIVIAIEQRFCFLNPQTIECGTEAQGKCSVLSAYQTVTK